MCHGPARVTTTGSTTITASTPSTSWPGRSARLSPVALVLFRRCARFLAGFTMAAAHAMGEPELDRDRVEEAFAELAQASLIEVHFGAGTRYRYLELVRRRADELLDEAGERELAERRMTRWASAATGDVTYLDLPYLQVELPNLVVAADHACRLGDVDAALQITGASFVFVLAQRSELLDAKLTAGASRRPGTRPLRAQLRRAWRTPCSTSAATSSRRAASPSRRSLLIQLAARRVGRGTRWRTSTATSTTTDGRCPSPRPTAIRCSPCTPPASSSTTRAAAGLPKRGTSSPTATRS